jgi:hypothetical protein
MKSILLLAATLLGVTFSFSQNVGIGAPSPEVKLHVIDTFDVADGASGAFINVQNATLVSPVGTLSGIRFKLDGVNSGTNSRYKGGILFQKTSGFGVGSLLFATNSAGNNSSITAADAKMTITSTGNIGIGTTTPTLGKLQIEGAVSTDLLHVSTGPSSNGLSMSVVSGYPTFGFNTMLNSGYKFIGDGYAGMFQYSPVAGDLNYFSSNASGTSGGGISFLGSFFTLDAAGRVGLSTGTPTAKLHVNGNMVIGAGSINPATGYSLSVDGKIIAEEIKVQLSTGWPDYVFSSNYKLMPIEELENSINKNKHLPNIPSAADITAEKGFELGEMNRKLLEKVEELTLYIIQLKKENNSMETRLNKVEKKLDRQQ